MTHRLGADDLRASVFGALELEESPGGLAPLRLPGWTRPQHADGGIDRMSAQTSGVRLRLLTAARTLRLEATFTRTASAAHPARPLQVVAETPAGAQLVGLDEGDLLLEAPDRSATRVAGSPSTLRFDLGEAATERLVTIRLPHSAATVIHGITADAPLRPAPAEGPRWVHYGSSISHGSDLDDPRRPWPHQAALALGLDLVSLGFAGNAMLDPFVARAIAQAPADAITLKIGINIVNGDTMRARTLVPAVHNFLDLVRAGHPDTPITVITALACPIHETTPGPTREVSPGKAGGTPRDLRPGDGTLTLERTRALIGAAVRSRDDAFLHLLDGTTLLGTADAARLPDNLHPDGAGHDLIARRFVAAARAGTVPLGL